MNSNTKTILSRETIQDIMRKHFGQDRVVDTIDEITEGWFNAIYMVAFTGPDGADRTEVVLKTGVQESTYVLTYEQDLMWSEVEVYGLLQDTIIPTPRILAKDFTRTLVDCNYFIMEKLQGDNWGHLEDKISPDNEQKLIAEVARYTAALHQVQGSYYGYVKQDPALHFPTWHIAFQSMVNTLIADGRKNGVALPYDEVLSAYEPLWVLLDEITQPCLVNFDMWKKNIMLVERDGEYVIDGIVDHERGFFGDPYADFIASATICGSVEDSTVFQENYSLISGKPFTYTHHDKIRMYMYNIYLYLLVGTEEYRYDEQDTRDMLVMCRGKLAENLAALKACLAEG